MLPKKGINRTIAIAAMWVLATFYVVQTYGLSYTWNFSRLASLFLGLIYLFTSGKSLIKNAIPTSIMIILLYRVIIHVLYNFPSNIIPVDSILMFITFFLFWNTFDLKYFEKIYTKLGVFFVLFFFIQYVAKFFGVVIPGIFSFLPISLNDLGDYWWDAKRDLESRPSSFFSEASHFAEYLIPLLLLKLYKENKSKQDYYVLIIVFLGLLLSQSGTAMLGLGLIGMAFVVYLIVNNNVSFFKMIIPIGLAVGAIFLYLRSEAGQSLFERTAEISIERENGVGQSAYQRMFRSYYVYDHYSLIEKITGTDNPEAIKRHYENNDAAETFGSDTDTFANTYQGCLLKTGFIGLVLFLWLMGGLWKGNSYLGKAILFVYLGLGFISPMYFTNPMTLYLLLAVSQKTKFANHNTL